MTNVRPLRAEFAIIDQLSRDKSLMEQLRELFASELRAQQRHFDAEFGHLRRSLDEVKKHLDKQDEEMEVLREQAVMKRQVYAIFKGIIIAAGAIGGFIAWTYDRAREVWPHK